MLCHLFHHFHINFISTVIFITNQLSTMENYKVNQNVQALEPVFKIWLNAIVKNTNKKQIFIRWIGYSSGFDLWIDRANVRLPESKRTMLQRNMVKKENFPFRQKPANLQGGDHISDITRNQQYIVNTNDPFRAEVINTCKGNFTLHSET